MYAVKAKKEETFTAVMPTRITANADATNISFKIKASDFLNKVKEYYGNSLSEDINNQRRKAARRCLGLSNEEVTAP